MKKLILWDIDGTLVLTSGTGMGALEGAFQKVDGRKPDLSKLDLTGRTDQWIAAQVLEHNQRPVTPETVHAYLAACLDSLHAEETTRESRVLPGILQLLD
ncbi:MAG: hypothetical protein HY302_12730 [Opitutae bacterium]|nr:hypothetical protein [Opitutae bacterium]